MIIRRIIYIGYWHTGTSSESLNHVRVPQFSYMTTCRLTTLVVYNYTIVLVHMTSAFTFTFAITSAKKLGGRLLIGAQVAPAMQAGDRARKRRSRPQRLTQLHRSPSRRFAGIERDRVEPKVPIKPR